MRNLIRRFVEAGVPGYHIEDQRPGTKKCGHQGGKVLVPSDEQIKRLNTARFQLDIMRVPGIIVARTDAEAANLIDSRADERDQPFLLGATNLKVPPYKALLPGHDAQPLRPGRHRASAAICSTRSPTASTPPPTRGSSATASRRVVAEAAAAWSDEQTDQGRSTTSSTTSSRSSSTPGRPTPGWRPTARPWPSCSSSASARASRSSMTPAEWREFAKTASLYAAREKARELGADAAVGLRARQDPGGLLPGPRRHPLRHREVAGGRAVRRHPLDGDQDRRPGRRQASSPTPIHAVYPDKMLAYNLSPSFNWDTTGMTRRPDARLPRRDRQDGLRLQLHDLRRPPDRRRRSRGVRHRAHQDGMLALARLQRKMRLVESPYRTPQTLVGGPRSDAALAASSGRTATTKSMGKGSTQHQHLVQTEVPKKLLEEWLALWSEHYQLDEKLRVQLRPRRAGGGGARTRHLRRARGRRGGTARQRAGRPHQGPARPQHPARCATRTPSPRSSARSA